VTGDYTKLLNEHIYNFYPIPNIIRVIKSRVLDEGGMWHIGGRREMHAVLVEKSEGKSPFYRPKHRC
jgi:uncharacterized membrane protein